MSMADVGPWPASLCVRMKIQICRNRGTYGRPAQPIKFESAQRIHALRLIEFLSKLTLLPRQLSN